MPEPGECRGSPDTPHCFRPGFGTVAQRGTHSVAVKSQNLMLSGARRRGTRTSRPQPLQSLLQHARLPQTGEISGFEQGAGRWRSQPGASKGPQTSNARKAIVARKPAGFGELGSGAFGFTFEGIGGGEAAAM